MNWRFKQNHKNAPRLRRSKRFRETNDPQAKDEATPDLNKTNGEMDW